MPRRGDVIQIHFRCRKARHGARKRHHGAVLGIGEGDRDSGPHRAVPDHPAGVNAPLDERPDDELAERVHADLPHDSHREAQRRQVHGAERRRATQGEGAAAGENLLAESRRSRHPVQDQVRVQFAHGDHVQDLHVRRHGMTTPRLSRSAAHRFADWKRNACIPTRLAPSTFPGRSSTKTQASAGRPERRSAS